MHHHLLLHSSGHGPAPLSLVGSQLGHRQQRPALQRLVPPLVQIIPLRVLEDKSVRQGLVVNR